MKIWVLSCLRGLYSCLDVIFCDFILEQRTIAPVNCKHKQTNGMSYDKLYFSSYFGNGKTSLIYSVRYKST